MLIKPSRDDWRGWKKEMQFNFSISMYISVRWKQAFIGYACSGCTMCDRCAQTACCVCGHSARPSASPRKSPHVQSPSYHRDWKRRTNFKALSTVHFHWNVFHRQAAQLSGDKAQLWTLSNTCYSSEFSKSRRISRHWCLNLTFVRQCIVRATT